MLKYIVRNMWRRKARTFLTVFGIVVNGTEVNARYGYGEYSGRYAYGYPYGYGYGYGYTYGEESSHYYDDEPNSAGASAVGGSS